MTPRIQPVSLLTKRHREGCVCLALGLPNTVTAGHTTGMETTWSQPQAASFPARRPRGAQICPRRDLGIWVTHPLGAAVARHPPDCFSAWTGPEARTCPHLPHHHRYRWTGQTRSKEQPHPGAGLQRRYLLPRKSDGAGGPSPPTCLLSLAARPRGTRIKAQGCGRALAICPTCAPRRVRLCNPTDCSPPGSSVHRTLQARRLGRAARPSSSQSSRPRD